MDWLKLTWEGSWLCLAVYLVWDKPMGILTLVLIVVAYSIGSGGKKSCSREDHYNDY